MVEHPNPQEKKIHLLAARIDELRSMIRSFDPLLVAERTGAVYVNSPEIRQFHFSLWRRPVCMAYPELVPFDAATGQAYGTAQQALILYYFITADGYAVDNRWISFSELPDGRFYTQAFSSYTGNEIVKKYGQDRQLFRTAASHLGGEKIEFADEAFAFSFLPKVNLAAVLWIGDDEFPASAQLLFNASTPHYLPTDACAIAGSMLTRMLIGVNST
jgi:hypothetical protein